MARRKNKATLPLMIILIPVITGIKYIIRAVSSMATIVNYTLKGGDELLTSETVLFTSEENFKFSAQ